MKKQLKTKEIATKKLFYNKWLFKIVLECEGMSYLHRKGLLYVNTVNVNVTENIWIKSSIQRVVDNRQNLTHIAERLELILPMADHQKRIESSTCAIFTNSEDMVNQIAARLSSFVTEVHKPTNQAHADYLLINKNKVICNALPLEGYRFRVYFKSMSIKDNSMQNFVKWAENYDDGRIHIPGGTKRLLESNNPYLYGQYFYAKDKKIASMALLVMGNYLNKAEEYVLKSEVNA